MPEFSPQSPCIRDEHGRPVGYVQAIHAYEDSIEVRLIFPPSVPLGEIAEVESPVTLYPVA